MTPTFALLAAMVALFVALIVVGWLFGRSSAAQASVEPVEARLVKHLPPDVQAEMKPRQPWLVISVVIADVVVLPIIGAGLISDRGARCFVDRGFRARRVSRVRGVDRRDRKNLDRRKEPGRSAGRPQPESAGPPGRRSSWLKSVAFAQAMAFGIVFQAVRDGHLLFLAIQVDIALLTLLTYLMYSDRVWLAERGLYFGGRLYSWDGFERVAWTDDGRAFALRRRGGWRLKRWIVVPAPEGTREAAEEALRQVMPAKRPAVPRMGHLVRGLAALLAIGGSYWGLECFGSIRPRLWHGRLLGPDPIPLLVFGPGYLVTIGYLVLCLRVPSPGWQRAIWGASALVQGAWLLVFIGAEFRIWGGFADLIFGNPIFGAWWTFSFAASIYALISLRSDGLDEIR